jgi:hypothetical protein
MVQQFLSQLADGWRKYGHLRDALFCQTPGEDTA